MQNYRRHNGDFDLPVDGWDKLSMHDRHQLAERLKAQERILSQNPVAHSIPLDLDLLDARLRLVSDGVDIVPQVQQEIQGGIKPPYSQENELRDHIDDETEAFNDLVRDGGRPLYSIGLIEQVSRTPEEHRDILRPFWDYPRDSQVSWLVFRRQVKRWQAFRIWQIDNRGLEDDDGGFPAYVEMMKRLYTKDGYDEGVAKIEADPTYLKSGWEYERRIRRWQRHHQREPGCNGFSDYVDAMKQRLTRHGFTRSFELQANPKLQDKLTTWIEYLCFEYWWLDRYTDSIKRLQPDHDKRWQELMDRKILRPHETKEFVRTTASSIQESREENEARHAKLAAEAEAKKIYLLTQKDSRRHSIPEQERLRMLQAAMAKLEESKARLESIKRRNGLIIDFVRATFDYVTAKKDATGHAALVQWVLEQVPLVEAEIMQPQMIEAGPDTKNKKRKRAQDENKPEKRSSKKRKPGRGEVIGLSRSSRTGPANLADSRGYAFRGLETKITTKESPKSQVFICRLGHGSFRGVKDWKQDAREYSPSRQSVEVAWR
ncbi:protein kinase [Purpureocillium lilacinum]|uniref:Protein kinase n=1 Tax=Purpureocillium lilacinum TaxID=33203 RepID=A0A179F5T3_PURLI|nr:protein kinase [Purpureocillium lilacinum]